MSTGTTGYTGYAQGAYTPEAIKGWSDRCCDEVAKAVDDNPTGALLTAFGAGVGIGVALALAFSLPAAKPKKRSMSEELGNRVLSALQDILPDSIAKRMG